MHRDNRPDTIRWMVAAVVAIAFVFAGGRFSHAGMLENHAVDHSHVMTAASGHEHDQQPPNEHSDRRGAGEVHCGAPILAASSMPELTHPRPVAAYRQPIAQSFPGFGTLLDPPPPRNTFWTV